MKKIFLLLGMAAAMVNFAGCQKNEIEDPNAKAEGSSFEIVAGIDQDATKTTLTGKNVEWEEGDVIYVVTSEGPWGLPYQEDNAGTSIAEYTYEDGKFTSSATIENGEYEFLAMYTNQKSYHRQDASSHKLDKEQYQNCADPTAHIKANDALVGAFSAEIPMDAPAQVTMKHLYTMMQVDIKNNTGAAVEIKKFEMKAAGADLAGVFNVDDFYDAVITTKQDPSETVAVNVTGGSVASGATLPVYFVMAPISGYTGDVTFKVTDASGNTYSKTVAMTDITFEAGKYNTTPYAISTPDKVEAKGLPFVETFGSSLGEFTAQTVGALPDGLTYVWAYASGYGAKASAYVGGTRYNQTTYLVSPVLSLASVESAKMSFEHTGKYFEGDLEEEAAVCVRIVGGDWESLTIPTYFSGNDWTFVNSGDIDLSDYVGKEIQIGFRYTSTSTSAGTWEIKNVEVCEKTVGGGEPDEPEGATTVTFDFTSADELTALGVVLPEAGKGTDISEMALVKDEVTMTATDGSTTTRVWNSTSGDLDLRVYKNGGSLTLSVAEGNHITKVAFTGSDLVNFSSSVGSYSSSVWTGSSQSINFSASGTVKVKTISVTCVSGEGETPTIQPRNLAFSAATATATVGQPFTEPTLSGVTTGVEYTSSNAAVATVDAETGAVTLVGAGTTTITASAPATAEYEAGEASYTLTVSAAVADDTDYSGTYAIVAYRNTSTEQMYYYLTNEVTTGSTKRLVAEAAGTECPVDGVEVNKTKLWTLTKSGNIYTVQSAASGGFISWSSGNSATLSESGLEFTIAKEEDGTYLLQNEERYLSLNTTAGTNYFAMYAGTQTQNLYLIKAVEGEEAVPKLTGITVNATKTTFTVGDEFAFEGTVTANYSNGTTKDVTESADFYGYNNSQEGPQTITVTYEGKTATYTITVSAAQGGGDQPAEVVTYQHIFTQKPATGSVTLSDVAWTLDATNLNGYNSASYAGVQFGTSNKTGKITLTSQNPFTYKEKSNIKEIRLWLNNGSGTITPKVTINGVDCTMDGTIVKNQNAGSDYTKASLVKFTPSQPISGTIVIDLNCNKAGYFCAMEIDVQ